MIKLVVGVGNPGIEYENTRHNIGWILLDTCSLLDGTFWKAKFKGHYTEKTIAGEKVYFLKPNTYMNLSGESVGPLCKFFKIEASEILVLQDELDLPFGQIQFKKGGGLAGHNGLKSITSHMGSQDFFRMRIGIGRPVHGSVSSWVLGKFSGDQQTELDIVMKNCDEALSAFLKDGMKAATKYNKKNFLEIK